MRSMVRLAVGLVLVVAALYVILGEQLAGTSADAVVNAQVVIVRAPIDGDLRLATAELGSRLEAGQLVGTLTDPRPDDLRLTDLRRMIAQVRQEIERERAMIDALQSTRGTFDAQARAYSQGRVKQLESRLAEARTSVDAAQARLRESAASFRRAAELNRTGSQTVAELNRTRSVFEVGAQELQAAQDRIDYLSIELAAARKGTFLGDSYNDTPFSQQKLEELDLRLSELHTQLLADTRRVAALSEQSDEEQVRLTRFREARVAVPVHAVLWEVISANGEYVRRGQDLVRLVDCGSTVVTASVREGLYNRLKVGDAAQFRLNSDDRVFVGTVSRLAGSGAESIYRSLAIGPSQEHLKRYDVTLVFPEVTASPELSCAVGRTGRVVFSGRPLDSWRNLTASLGLS